MIAPAAVSWLSSGLGLTLGRHHCGMLPRMKLLVVEDDAALQATLVRTLLRRGFGVTAVGDGAAALERWSAAPPDAVVLDLTLPTLDGLQVLAEARAAAKKSMPLRFGPDTNSSQDVFNCMDSHVAPWGLSTDILFQAAAALAEFLEASSELLKEDRSFQVVFSFDHYHLTLDIEYRGHALDFPVEKPMREAFMKDPRSALSLSGYLMQSYAAHIEAHEENGTQKVRCIFESSTEGKASS